MRQETQGEMFEQKTSDNCSSDTVTIKLKQKDMVHRFVVCFSLHSTFCYDSKDVFNLIKCLLILQHVNLYWFVFGIFDGWIFPLPKGLKL